MIIRSYKAVVKDGKQRDLEQFLAERKALVERDFYNTEKIMNANVFSFHSELYCYIESIGEEILPNQLFCGMEEFLAKWPDGEDKYFHPMTNIFHFNEPQSVSHWARKKKPDYCFGMLAKLIPDFKICFLSLPVSGGAAGRRRQIWKHFFKRRYSVLLRRNAGAV